MNKFIVTEVGRTERVTEGIRERFVKVRLILHGMPSAAGFVAACPSPETAGKVNELGFWTY